MFKRGTKLISEMLLVGILTINGVNQALAAPTLIHTQDEQSIQILVKAVPGTVPFAGAADSTAATVTNNLLAPLGWQIVEVDADRAPALLAQLQADARIDQVALDYPLETTWSPNDPGLTDGNQWALQKLGSEIAWEFSSGTAVTVAVLDSGIDPNHPDLVGQTVTGYNFYDNTTATPDLCGHGTHVSGIIAATTNNSIGVAGVAPNAKIMPLKVIDDDCVGSYIRLMEAIVYATDHGVRVISITSGGGYYHAGLHEAIQYAERKGVLVVVSAGNRANDEPFYPGSYAESFTVAGTDRDDAQYDKSNFGDQIDISAPATSIYSTYFDNGQSVYAYMSGTSMSAPHVAGVAALILALDPTLSLSGLQTALLASTVDLGAPGWDPIFGAGRISATRSVAAVTPASGNVKPGHIRLPNLRRSDCMALSVTAQEDGIALTWTQTDMLENHSVVVYRATVPVFEAALDITELPATATGSYIDTNVNANAHYSYWLVLAQEDVELETTEQVDLTFTPAPVARQLFIPMVQRVN
jgi:subtilisin family serine protease